jgi:hypothetical protein
MGQHAMTVLIAWMNFDTSYLTDKVITEFISELEDSLCWTLSKEFSSLALLTYDCTAVIRRFMEIKATAFKLCDDNTQRCLLTTVVSSDPIKFGEAFLQTFVTVHDKQEYQKLFACGILDKPLSAILKYSDIQIKYRKEILCIIDDVNKRLTALCIDFNISTDRMNDLLSLTQILMDKERESEQKKLNADVLADLLARLLTESNQEANTASKQKCIEVATYICVERCNTESDRIKSLSSVLFLKLCDAIVQSSYQGTKDGNGYVPCVLPSMQPIAWMKELLSKELSFDMAVLNIECDGILRSVIKVCLRHGMKIDSDSSIEIRLTFLQLVSLLISFAYSNNNPLGCIHKDRTTANKSLPSQIFDMVMSHSKFDILMGVDESSSIQVELSRILFICMAHAADIEFNIASWKLLLSCYDCGFDDKNLFLLSTLYEYSRTSSQVRV